MLRFFKTTLRYFCHQTTELPLNLDATRDFLSASQQKKTHCPLALNLKLFLSPVSGAQYMA